MATHDIFIRSYHRDFEWLAYCLQSIERHCSGFREVVLVVPASSRAKLDWLGLRGTRTVTCRNYETDYLGQQVTKLHADQISDADYICHVDSDWIFTRRLTPDDLFVDGRPSAGTMPVARLPSALPWPRAMQRFFGRPVAFDFMRRQPYVFPRWLYPALRRYALARHGTDLASYVLAQPPLGFSEFNALSGFAFFEHHGSFTWLDVADDPRAPHCRAFWSWGGLTPAIRGEIEMLLGDGEGLAC
jgi:hypothetical protein